MRQAAIREIMSGRRKGLTANVLRAALSIAESAYGAGIYLRNRRYDRDTTRAHHVGVPVVSVGNVTTGGTGKTPMVAWVAGWYRAHGVRVAVISRGYGAKGGSPNDEALELQRRLPDVPHLQNPNRVAAARVAIEKFASELIVLDDGFQHRRIHRDLDLVLIDALVPFGYGHLLPRGLLREPLSALARAHAVALSRADLISAEERADLKSEIVCHAPSALWIEIAHRARKLVSVHGESDEIPALRGCRVAAFCGIGNPAGFRRTVIQCGAELVDCREFPDHHAYGPEDTRALAAWAEPLSVDFVLCTMKDFVKLRVDQLGGHPLRALSIDVEVLEGGHTMEAMLRALLPRHAAS